MVEKGCWIAFEGNDGAGKSTILSIVGEHLRNMGIEVVETREPGGNPFSEKIRPFIFDSELSEDPITQLLLFTAARRRNIQNVVIPAIRDGKIVLGDRSEGSTYAYQCYQYGLPFDTVRMVNDLVTEGIKPDLTILLRVNSKIALERIKMQRFDGMDYFHEASLEDWEKRNSGYEELLIRNRWWVIDADQEVERVFQDVLDTIKKSGVILKL